jgi:acyl carrier protein
MLAELESILKDVLCEDNIEGVKYVDIDSLDKLDFVFRVETQFNVSLSKKELMNITTLEGLAELLDEKINKTAEVP